MDLQDHKEVLVGQEQRVIQVLWAHKDVQALRDTLDLLEPQDNQAHLDPLDLV